MRSKNLKSQEEREYRRAKGNSRTDENSHNHVDGEGPGRSCSRRGGACSRGIGHCTRRFSRGRSPGLMHAECKPNTTEDARGCAASWSRGVVRARLAAATVIGFDALARALLHARFCTNDSAKRAHHGYDLDLAARRCIAPWRASRGRNVARKIVASGESRSRNRNFLSLRVLSGFLFCDLRTITRQRGEVVKRYGAIALCNELSKRQAGSASSFCSECLHLLDSRWCFNVHVGRILS